MLFKKISFALALLAVVSCGEYAPNPQALEEYAKAKLSYSQGHLEDAHMQLALLVAREGGFVPAHILFGRTLFFQKKYEEARVVFQRVLEQRRDSVEAALWLVRTNLQSGKADEAEAQLKHLLTVNQDDPRLAYQMALIREAQGDLVGAKGFLESAVLFDEELALVHYESARVANQFQDSALAKKHLQQALNLLPADSLFRKPMEKLDADFKQ